MIEGNHDSLRLALTRAKEAIDFLKNKKIKDTQNTEVVVQIFYDETQAALFVFGWILTHATPGALIRPIETEFPKDWSAKEMPVGASRVNNLGKFEIGEPGIELEEAIQTGVVIRHRKDTGIEMLINSVM